MSYFASGSVHRQYSAGSSGPSSARRPMRNPNRFGGEYFRRDQYDAIPAASRTSSAALVKTEPPTTKDSRQDSMSFVMLQSTIDPGVKASIGQEVQGRKRGRHRQECRKEHRRRWPSSSSGRKGTPGPGPRRTDKRANNGPKALSNPQRRKSRKRRRMRTHPKPRRKIGTAARDPDHTSPACRRQAIRAILRGTESTRETEQ